MLPSQPHGRAACLWAAQSRSAPLVAVLLVVVVIDTHDVPGAADAVLKRRLVVIQGDTTPAATSNGGPARFRPARDRGRGA